MKIKLPFYIISKYHYETLRADHYYMERYREMCDKLLAENKKLKESN